MGANREEDRKKFASPLGSGRGGNEFRLIWDAAPFGVIWRAMRCQPPFGLHAIRSLGRHGGHPSILRLTGIGACLRCVPTAAAILWLSSLLLPAGEPAAVNISLPGEGMLLRANVPIFGSVRLPKEAKLKSWRLEYGPGPSPGNWILLKAGTSPVEKDPNEKGEVKWNLNKEPEGNLANWATGLGSYGYGTWQQNLNGIYTLRLVAETTEGKVSEVRRTVFIGEAILRTAGGTAISSDQKCRISVPPFAFGGDIGRVVAIIKQVPASAGLSGLSGVEDTRYEAAQIYKTVPAGFQLLSPIYRVYPNGFEVEPGAIVELDCDAMSGATGQNPILLRQYNPETSSWEPLKTTWFGKTASAPVGCFARPQAYLALMRSETRPAISDVRWIPKSALEGEWSGKTSPAAEIFVEGAGNKAEAVADSEGSFSVPFTLGWEPAEYRIRAVPLEGNAFATEQKVVWHPGVMVKPVAPRLSVEARHDAGDYVLISCEDKGLLGSPSTVGRSMSARILSKDARGVARCELKESIPGSAIFLGRINASNLTDKAGRAFEQPLTVEVGGQVAGVTLRDSEPPTISLSSPTHPNFLYLSSGDGKQLQTTRAHSRAKVEVVEGAWKISGTGREHSARVVSWPVEPFSPREWPVIGFTYRLFEPAPWQLHIRAGMDLAAYHFNSDDSEDLGLPVYARSSPLTADGHWHYWQGSLLDGTFARISGIAFGSWVKTGFRRVDPGFKGNASQALEIRDILIGRPSDSSRLEVRAMISDRSRLKSVSWWVDGDADGKCPASPDGSLSGIEWWPKKTAQTWNIPSPGDGRWFFHVQASDEAGNVSQTFHYPVFIFGGVRQEKETPVSTLTWKQPDGQVEIPLRGWGSILDAKTLALEWNDVTFSILKPMWNAGTEVLTLDASSFPDGAPLGFDGEAAAIRISGKDVSGKPIEPRAFDLKIQSIFTWQQEKSGFRIVSSDKTNCWMAAWENPTAPWRKYFPGSANNVLMLMKVIPDKYSFRVIRWRRPIVLSDSRKMFMRESLAAPGFEMLESLQTQTAQVFSASGTPVIRMSDSSTGDTWITQMSGSDPFLTGRLRVTMRRGRQLEQHIVDASELQFLLDNQGSETLRIDAWLPPEDGFLSLEAPGDRRLFVGDENDSEWRKTKEVSLSSGKRWRRVAVLVETKSTYKKMPGANVSGKTCW